MHLTKYLIISKPARHFSKPAVRLVDKISNAKMSADSIPLKISIALPDEIFKRPQFQASITINPDDVSKPVINAEVIDNIKEVLDRSLGIDLQINLVENEKDH